MQTMQTRYLMAVSIYQYHNIRLCCRALVVPRSLQGVELLS